MICQNPVRPVSSRCGRGFSALRILLGAALLLLCPAWSRATTYEVDAGAAGISCCIYKTVTAVSGVGTNLTTISVGDTVHWVWKTNFHSITSDTNAWTDPGVKNAPSTFDVTFNTPGSYPYHCSIHGGPGSGMFGIITVKAPTPAAPANLTATASDSKVVLHWDAGAGATGYNVKRGTTSGGPYSTVALNVAATTYTDTAVTDGATYFYVVTAVNSAGESGNSNEATATPTGQTVTGKIAFEDVADLAAAAIPLGLFTLDFRSPGTTIPRLTQTTTLTPVGSGSPFGSFTLTNIPNGTYDVAVKGTKTLRFVQTNVTISGASSLPDTLLRGGDANNDNAIDIGDFGVLVNAYNGDVNVAGSGYDSSADFNDDGKVDIADFGILINNYTLNGTP